MGLRAALGMTAVADTLGRNVLPFPQIKSPSAPAEDHLQSIVWQDLLGRDILPMNRAEAMAVPAVARARHVICSPIARMPLVVHRGADRLPDDEQPTWAYRTTDGLSPWHRMLWTVDDLLFYPYSLWLTQRGAGDQLLHAARCPQHLWDFDTEGRIEVTLPDGERRVASSSEVILIPGPHEGILQFGARAIRHARDLQDATANAARNPNPSIELHQTGGEQLTNSEIDQLVDRWAKARRGENGGVAYTNETIEVKAHGAVDAHLVVEGRNAAAVDIARTAGIPASSIDATNAGASLTYETTQGRNLELADVSLGMYMSAITARLSLDDVVPRGQRTAFDASDYTNPLPAATGTPTQD